MFKYIKFIKHKLIGSYKRDIIYVNKLIKNQVKNQKI